LIKICVATCAYRGWRGDELEETLKDAGDAGYRFIEIQGSTVTKLIEEGAEGLKKLRRMLKGARLIPVAVYGPAFGGLTDEEARVGAAKIARFLNAAEWLGCGVYVSSDGSRTGAPWGIKNIITTLRCLESKVEETGIRIALEPHLHNNIEQISDYNQIFKEITNPKMGICIDTGHFHSAQVGVPLLVAKYPDRIFHVHLKDHKGLQPMPLGQGETDNLGCVRALKKVGYNGYLSVEMEIGPPYKAETPRYVREARIYTENLIKQA